MKPAGYKKMQSFQFISPKGSATSAMYQDGSDAAQIAERIAAEAGGNNWPLKINGMPLEKFDFTNVGHDGIHDITWASTRGI